MRKSSTMKGKQNVAYRTCSDEFLFLFAAIPRKTAELAMELLKQVDAFDNCLQVSLADWIKSNSLEPSNTHRRVKELISRNILKRVTDINNTNRLMFNPAYIWATNRDKLRFSILMYHHGSHSDAIAHFRQEKELGGRIDEHTGELISETQERLDAAEVRAEAAA